MKVRANQIQGMLRQWSDVETATKKAYESGGTAAKENEKYMDSMQGKIAATQAAWQALSNTLLSSDFLKGLIDGGQTLLNIVNAISKTIFGFPALLAVISGYLSASKNIGFFTTINQDLTGAITGASTLSNKMGILGNSFKDIFRTWKVYGKDGLKNIFANTSDKLVTSMDKDKLEDFFTQIKNGAPKVEALKKTMLGASKGARDLALSVDTSEEGLKNFRTTLDGVQVAEKGYTATTIGARIATVALQAALSFGIAIAIQGLITLFQKLKEAMPTVENTAEWLKNSSQEVKNIQDDISSLNSELTTTKNKIKELQSKPTLTLVEQSELDRLKQQNAELQRQIDLKKISLATAQDANAKEFVKAFNTRALHDPSTDKQWYNYAFPFINAFTDTYAMFRGNDSQVYANNIQEFDKYQKEYLEKAEASRKALLDGNEELAKSEDEAAKKAKEKMDAKSAEMSEYVTGLSALLDELGEYDYETLDDDAKAAVDYITWAQNALAHRKGYDESVFSSIYNSQKFVEGRKAIEKLKESGNLTADSLENLYKSGTNTSFNAMIDNFMQIGLIADTSANSFGLLVNQINGTTDAVDENGNAIDNTTEKVDRFKQLMEEKGTDKNPSFVEGIEKSVEQFQKLEDALVKFESGTLTDKEKTSLYKAFPQLTAYADNLGAGIRNLLGEMRGDVVSQFTEKIDEFKKAGATEEEIAQLEAYERTILNIADSVDSVKNALDSMKSVFKDLDSVIKDYNENQYFSLESLEKLGQNGQRYLSYLSYENGQLKINEEAYKKLVLAQIDEIETKATLQATTDLQSLTDETTAKEYLAKVNIDLAQSQLTAAQAAFQYALALKLAQGGSVAKAAQKVADNLNSLRNIFASARSQVDDYAAAMLGATSATEKKAKASEKAKKALESEQRALEHSKKALEDEKKALEDTKSEYEKAQKAIEDLIKWTQNYIKQIKEDEVKALQDKKEKFDELIEKQKESLQAEKDLHDYEKSVGEKQNDLASNALKVSVSSLDDSGAGKKAYKQAQEEYKKSQIDMEDFLYDHSIETREKALDQLKEDTDKSYDEHIKTIQDYLSNEVQLYRDACKMIDNDNGTLYGKLLNYCLTYTTTGKKEFDHMWSLAQTAMEEYNVASIGTMQFMDELKGRIYDVDDAIDAVSKNIETYESRISDVKTQLDNLKDAAVEAKNAIDTANSTPLTADISGASISPRASQTSTSKQKATPTSNIKTWSVNYLGTDFTTRSYDRNAAIDNLYKQIKNKYPLLPSLYDPINKGVINFQWRSIFSGLHSYAKGTKSAKGGLSIVDEEGLFSEFIPYQIDKGRYSFLPEGNPVFSKAMTNTMFDFASNPEKFLAEKGLSPLSQEELANLGLWGDSSQLGMINSAFGVGGLSGLIEKITGGSGITSSSATTNNIAPVVNITIQGDATQSTVNALHAEAENIVQRARNAAHNDFIETVLKGRKWR